MAKNVDIGIWCWRWCLSLFVILVFFRVSDPLFFLLSGSGSWGYPGEGGGGKGKNDFFFWVFFTFQMILNNGGWSLNRRNEIVCKILQNYDLFIPFLTFLARIRIRPGQKHADPWGSGSETLIFKHINFDFLEFQLKYFISDSFSLVCKLFFFSILLFFRSRRKRFAWHTYIDTLASKGLTKINRYVYYKYRAI